MDNQVLDSMIGKQVSIALSEGMLHGEFVGYDDLTYIVDSNNDDAVTRFVVTRSATDMIFLQVEADND